MRKPRKLTAYLLVVLMLLSTSGCATLEEHKGAAIGAGVGATAGILLGGSTGGRIVGGLVGALVGGAIGHYAFDRKKSGEETARDHNYDPSQGTQLKIEDAFVSPETVKGGEEVNITMTYAVLNPSSEAETSLDEIREITHKGDLVGRPEVRVSRAAGTYTSSIPIRLPKATAPGTYKVKTMVKSAGAEDERTVTFTVL